MRKTLQQIIEQIYTPDIIMHFPTIILIERNEEIWRRRKKRGEKEKEKFLFIVVSKTSGIFGGNYFRLACAPPKGPRLLTHCIYISNKSLGWAAKGARPSLIIQNMTSSQFSNLSNYLEPCWNCVLLAEWECVKGRGTELVLRGSDERLKSL